MSRARTRAADSSAPVKDCSIRSIAAAAARRSYVGWAMMALAGREAVTIATDSPPLLRRERISLAMDLARSRWVLVALAIGFVGHGVAVVDNENVKAGARGGQLSERIGLAAERAGERDSQEKQQGASRRQEQKLLESQSPAVSAHGSEQEIHGGPLDLLETAAVEDVDEDGDGRQQSAGREKCGGNK